MASARYTLNITPDPPEEPPHEMTAKEKRENFWFYYKWHVIVGIFVAVLLVMLVRDVMTNDPADYTIGVITDSGLPTGAADVLSEKLAPFFDDRDGDGVVTVAIQDYTLPLDEAQDSSASAGASASGMTGGATDPYTLMAGVTRLTGDLQSDTCVLFLTDNAAAYSEKYGFFAQNDGTLADVDEAVSDEDLGVLWADCPALASLGLGSVETISGLQLDLDAYMENFRLIPRWYDDEKLAGKEKTAAYYEGNMAAYDAMTAQ